MKDLHNVPGILLDSNRSNKRTGNKYSDVRVAANPRYIFIAYLMHLVITSSVSIKFKNEFLSELYFIIFIEFMTAAYKRNFPSPLDKSISRMVTDKLTNRNIIKTQGSWFGYYKYRTVDVIFPNGVNVKRLTKFSAKDAADTIVNIRGNIYSTINNMTEEVYNLIHAKESLVGKGQLITDTEGEERLLEVMDSNSVYVKAVKNSIIYSREFIDNDVLNIVIKIRKHDSNTNFVRILTYMSEHYINDKFLIDKLIETCISANISYLYMSKLYPPYDKDMVSLIKFLRGFWTSSTTKNKDLIEFKRMSFKLVAKITGLKVKWKISHLAISLAIYIMLLSVVRSKR